MGISKSNRPILKTEIQSLKNCLHQFDVTLNVFVDNYNYKNGEEREMMVQAFKEIEASDFFIAEVTKKAIGVGVEVGYARAINKPIIYLRRKGSSYSTTVAGSSDYCIEYESEKQLIKEIKSIFRDF